VSDEGYENRPAGPRVLVPAWLGLNIVGMVAYGWLTSAAFFPADDGGGPAPGEATFLLFVVAPVLFAALAVNVGAALAIALRAKPERRRRLFAVWGGVVLAWLGLLTFRS